MVAKVSLRIDIAVKGDGRDPEGLQQCLPYSVFPVKRQVSWVADPLSENKCLAADRSICQEQPSTALTIVPKSPLGPDSGLIGGW